MARKKGTYTKQTADPDLLQHIQLLGLETVKEYRQWCVQNGFQNHIRKRRLRRRQECFHYREMLAESRLKQKKRERSSIVEKLSVVCSENVNHDSLTDPLLKRIERVYRVNKHCLDRSDVIRNAFLQLVSHIHCRQAKFFIHSSANHDWDYSQEQRYLKALVFIASEARSWIRPIKAWRPVGSNARRQFSSLLRHLFVEYQMPLFFDSVWLNNWAPVCYNWREWYLDVGRGQNICHCRLPIPYTKKMAHHFMRAPQDLTFLQALRWGQILGMGGDARLARSILASRIGVGFPRDEFWSTAIQWLIHHPGLDRTQIGLFVDYFIIQRYGVSPDEFDEDSMPVNSYSLKGRTFSSLLRDVTEWHREQENKNRAPDYEWEASGIPEFNYQDEVQEHQNGKRWVIRELLNSYELETEGNQMKHCVGTYVSACVSGECSIWSMQIELKDGFKKAITIEVSKETNEICEVRGKANRSPNSRERRVLRRWAETAGLKVASYV